MQPIKFFGENEIRKELCFGPPYWCSTCATKSCCSSECFSFNLSLLSQQVNNGTPQWLYNYFFLQLLTDNKRRQQYSPIRLRHHALFGRWAYALPYRNREALYQNRSYSSVCQSESQNLQNQSKHYEMFETETEKYKKHLCVYAGNFVYAVVFTFVFCDLS